jgi:hypothetical protein
MRLTESHNILLRSSKAHDEFLKCVKWCTKLKLERDTTLLCICLLDMTYDKSNPDTVTTLIVSCISLASKYLELESYDIESICRICTLRNIKCKEFVGKEVDILEYLDFNIQRFSLISMWNNISKNIIEDSNFLFACFLHTLIIAQHTSEFENYFKWNLQKWKDDKMSYVHFQGSIQ